jgi:hypothetical protein
LQKGDYKVSFFKMNMDRVSEILVLALIMVFMFAVLYSGMDIIYKLGLGALVFTLVFVSVIADQAMKQQREQEKKRLK